MKKIYAGTLHVHRVPPVVIADSPKAEGMRDLWLCIIRLSNKYKAKTYQKFMNLCESLNSLIFAFQYVGL